ncbi:MAG: hypothetical protein ACOY94_17400 [Bacillota bacterium]
MSGEKKRMLTPDMFEVNENGEVVIRDQDLLNQVKSAKATETESEQGVFVGVVVGTE